MTDTIENLIAEYTTWCTAQDLPQLSADEHDYETLTPQQREYIRRFIERWDNASDNHA
jgi:hypothetical protein